MLSLIKRLFFTLVAFFLFFQCPLALSKPKDNPTTMIAFSPPDRAAEFFSMNPATETDGIHHLTLPEQKEPMLVSLGTNVLNGNLDRLQRRVNQRTGRMGAPPPYYLNSYSSVPTQSTVSVQYYTVSQLANICFNKYLVDVYVMPRVMSMIPQSITNLMPGKTINF